MTLHLKNVGIGINDTNLIEPFTLSIAAGDIVTLMGPSGCGKSSLLAFIAGDLAAPLRGSGNVELNGVDLETLRPELRKVGRLFQDDLLFPHLTVGENILFE
jgi:putative thiamine transport system ATP-binding protein